MVGRFLVACLTAMAIATEAKGHQQSPDGVLRLLDHTPAVARERYVDILPRNTRKEVLCAALTAYHEARGTTERDRLGVIMVARNRAALNSRSLCSVIFQPYQFSWTRRPAARIMPRNKEAWRDALWLAYRVVVKNIPDITGGATHFYAPRLASPDWRKRMVITARLGGHIYLR